MQIGEVELDMGGNVGRCLVTSRHPESGARNIGTYRMQVFDRRTTGMHWQRHKGGAEHEIAVERTAQQVAGDAALVDADCPT